MADVFTINGQTFADLGLDNIIAQKVNLGTDTVQVRRPRPIVGVDAFVFDSTLYTFALNGVPFFVGRCDHAEADGVGSSQATTYNFSGPWKDMEQLSYEATFMFGTSAVSLGKIVLFPMVNGVKTTSAAQTLADLIAQAAAEGANIQLGDISALAALNLYPPKYEAGRDPLITDLIKQVMLWAPDLMDWIDYSVSPPSFNVASRTAATVLNLTFGQLPLVSVNLNPRYDLLTRGVVVKYVYTNQGATDTSTPDLNFIIQSAGATSGRRVVRQTFELDPGDYKAPQRMDLTSLTMPTVFDAPTAYWWWQFKLPFLYDVDEITKIKIDADSWIDLGFGTDQLYEITEGTPQQWMRDQYGFEWYKGSITADITWKFTVAGKQYERTERFTAKALTTNDDREVFFNYKTASQTLPEVPGSANIAAIFQNAFGTLQQEGMLLLQNATMDMSIRPGMVVNIAAGKPEWAGMLAQVQQVQFAPDTKSTSITVGPPAHLSLSDMRSYFKAAQIVWQNSTKDNGPTNPAEASTPPGGTVQSGGAVPTADASGSQHADKVVHVVDKPTDGSDAVNYVTTHANDGSQTLLQMMRAAGGGSEAYAAFTLKADEASLWLYDSQGTKKNITLNTKTGMVKVWDEATGEATYMKPGSVVVTADGDNVYGEMKATPSGAFTFWGYDNGGSGTQIKGDTGAGNIKVWKASGETVEVAADGVTVSDASGNYGAVGPGYLDLSKSSQEIYLSPSDMTGTYAGMKPVPTCGDTNRDMLTGDPA